MRSISLISTLFSYIQSSNFNYLSLELFGLQKLHNFVISSFDEEAPIFLYMPKNLNFNCKSFAYVTFTRLTRRLFKFEFSVIYCTDFFFWNANNIFASLNLHIRIVLV